jgi:anaerobic C4-dicarboxylate transporter
MILLSWIIGAVMIAAILYRMSCIFKLDKIEGDFLIKKVLARGFMWFTPNTQKPTNREEKILIKRANISISIFWGGFVAILILIMINSLI